ncbi:MAG: allantoinase AllB [Bacteriovoracia bacterium]
MSPFDLILKSSRVVTPSGVQSTAIAVRAGRVEQLLDAGATQAATQNGVPLEDMGDRVIMPGLVDTHVHVNEPGRTDWEGFASATQAAAAGGITTLVDMPLNCIPVTTSLRAFETKLASLGSQLTVDCGFYGGVVPGNERELTPMLKAGVLGFKAFLTHSGIDDFPDAKRADLARAMPILTQANSPLLIHAELEPVGAPALALQNPRRYAEFVASRPKSWENAAVQMMTELCEKHRTRTHIVHLSSSEAVDTIRAARARGLPFSAETCPHYLTFAAEDIPDGDTRFKCTPPIREKSNRERLWDALMAGEIDFVVSDHSPCTADLKLLDRGDFEKAWGGISSLQFGLAVVWSQARARGADLSKLARWMCENPAQLVGLEGHKGRIAPGYDADLVVWDPDAPVPIEKTMIHHKNKLTPYEHLTVTGKVERTYVRGQLVYKDGAFASTRVGKPILRK